MSPGGFSAAIPVTLYPADLAAGGYPMTFDVTSVGDTTPPVLSALVLSPAAVDVASALDVVVVTATITDDLSGVAASTLCGVGGTGQCPPGELPITLGGAGTRSGSPNRWAGTPTPSECPSRNTRNQGRGLSCTLRLVDCLGNSRTLNPADLAAAGYGTSFRVLPAPATFAVSPSTWNAPGSGGGESVSITSTSNMASWAATSDAAWLTVTPTTGLGSGTVTLSAAAQTVSWARMATVTIAGQTVAVTQTGATTTVTSARVLPTSLPRQRAQAFRSSGRQLAEPATRRLPPRASG